MNPISFGKRIYRLETVSSTQDFLRDLALQGAEPGAVVVASEQILGRGRRGRAWDSQAGKGLWVSVLLAPDGAVETFGWVSLWAGVVTHRTLMALGQQGNSLPEKPQLKWPNDIFVGEHKLAGILAESLHLNNGALVVLLGIGINLLQRREDFPPHLRDLAASYYELSRQVQSPEIALEALILTLEELYPLLQPLNPTAIRDLWLPLAWGWQQRLQVQSVNRCYIGKFVDLGPHGEICLETEDEGVKHLSSITEIQKAGKGLSDERCEL